MLQISGKARQKKHDNHKTNNNSLLYAIQIWFEHKAVGKIYVLLKTDYTQNFLLLSAPTVEYKSYIRNKYNKSDEDVCWCYINNTSNRLVNYNYIYVSSSNKPSATIINIITMIIIIIIIMDILLLLLLELHTQLPLQ